VLDERLGLEPAELALLTVLLLRGPQTLNELRTRTERAHRFDDLDAVQETLEDLARRDEPLVVLLPRQPGQKEVRWMHLLGGEVDVEDLARAPAPTERSADLSERVADLEARVSWLESVIADFGVTPSSP
jgi:hypothetical protein